MSSFQSRMCGGKTITSRAQAQMSLPYALAAELQFGKVGLAEIEPSAWTSEWVDGWLRRISVGVNDRMADEDEPIITVGTTDNRRYTVSVPFPSGSPANPLPDERVIGKFHDLSGKILPPSTRKRIEEVVLTLDDLADIFCLPALLKAAT
jgi:2-methylcitrate dehydratase PrpD